MIKMYKIAGKPSKIKHYQRNESALTKNFFVKYELNISKCEKMSENY